ncbi:uncharacterized protein KY384_001688 [Bacidia gigantensis]|uniref:uncharacterized protein n=1 Tax=Bacidia gigantensis TaxID=2732470 RepID=UPI001D04C9AA|nr:uncharacterized protein KY384_001688 [Bacidia gigantensis]KAG8533947.1 hypothetical protein KY384_001688 [Bacidia gigantensis]
MSSSPHASSSSPVPQHDERTSSSSSPCPPPPPLPPTNSDDEVRRLLINTPVCKQVTDEDLDLARQKFELMMTKRVDALVAKINEHRNPLPPPKAKRSPVFDFSRIDVELVRETASCVGEAVEGDARMGDAGMEDADKGYASNGDTGKRDAAHDGE